MARQINAGGSEVKREDMFLIDPEEIVFDIHDNTRWHPPGEQPLNHARVVQYAKEFLDPKIGQLQPITLRPVENKRVAVAYGFHRLAAGIMVKNGSPEDDIPKTPNFKIRCTLKDLNPDEAIRAGIRENKSREGVSPIDDAENLRRLRNLGDDDVAIKQTLGIVSDKWFGTLEKLLKLPDAIKLKVHRRQLAADAAAMIADRPASEHAELLAVGEQAAATLAGDQPSPEASAELPQVLASRALSSTAAQKADSKRNGKLNGAAIRNAIRDKKRVEGAKLGLTFGEAKRFLESLGEHENGNIKTIGETLLKLIEGKIGSRKAISTLVEVVKVKTVTV